MRPKGRTKHIPPAAAAVAAAAHCAQQETSTDSVPRTPLLVLSRAMRKCAAAPHNKWSNFWYLRFLFQLNVFLGYICHNYLLF